ncbi:hypothetical protein THIAE_06270 [Thiomicrospira aerophila AL3]|uniref:Lipoprotein n=1 Tax=Thiomicrospira aerophila AL3 TaxID=717772 RepID=W0DUP2_9GAMM|nr:hypothetical protein [Thiomicrospira aerophila]AHF02310.1 hypothetical protein THIAE_06270 [Thiomicrospira aerophila AL3]
MKTIKMITAVMLAVSVSSCMATSKKPLNISDDDWAAMSDEMKLYAYERQAQLDAQYNAELQRQQSAPTPVMPESLTGSTADSYGQRVQCTLNGEARIGGKWRKAEPFGFDIGRAESVEFDLYSGNHSSFGTATFDGVNVQACGTTNLPSYCVRIAATAHQLDRGGISQSVSSSHFFRGEMTCSLADRPTRR